MADINTPYNYKEWVRRNSGFTENQRFHQYTEYLKNWYAEKTNEKKQPEETTKKLYTHVLQQLISVFDNDQQNDFLQHIDFEDNFDLEIAIPFLARRLKDIALYIGDKRDLAQQTKLKYNLIGTEKALERSFYQYLLKVFTNRKSLFNNSLDRQVRSSIQPLSSVNTDFKISFEDLYDESFYFDSDPSINIETYINIASIFPLITMDGNFYNVGNDRILAARTSSSENFLFETRFYSLPSFEAFQLDPNGDVVTLFNSIPVQLLDNQNRFIQTDLNQNIIVNITVEDIEDIPIFEFEQYDFNRLNIFNLIQLIKKYSGLPFYYLDGSNPSLSGVLFEPEKPHAHLSNRYYPTVASIADSVNFRTINEIGGYFTPDKLAPTTYLSVDPIPVIDISSLENQYYIFPDPYKIDPNGRGLTLTDQFNIPISYQETLDWLKSDYNENQKKGFPKNIKHFQSFIPYKTFYEDHNYDYNGVSRSRDLFDFFNGKQSSEWIETHNYPLTFKEEFNVYERRDDRLVTNDYIYNWSTDIFGNHYSLYKPSLNILNYDKFSELGKVYVRNVNNTINTDLEALSSIYNRYNTQALSDIYDDLENSKIQQFDVINDTIIIKTPEYILIDKISYDFDTHEILPQNILFNYIQLGNDDYYGGFWFHEGDQLVTFCNVVSSSGSTVLTPDLYLLNLNNNNFNKFIITNPDLAILDDDFGDITDIERPVITYHNENNQYIIQFLAKNDGDKVLFTYELTPNWTDIESTIDHAYGVLLEYEIPELTISPEVITLNASDNEEDSIQINGSLVNLGSFNSVDVFFQWKKQTESNWNDTTLNELTQLSGFNEQLSSLDLDVVYEFRAGVQYDGTERSFGSIKQFEIISPTITTLQATDLDSSSEGLFITLNGEFNLGDFDSVDGRFQYRKKGESTWNDTSEQTLERSTYGQDGDYSYVLDTEDTPALEPETEYEYRAALKFGSSNTEIFGAILEFTSPAEYEVEIVATQFEDEGYYLFSDTSDQQSNQHDLSHRGPYDDPTTGPDMGPGIGFIGSPWSFTQSDNLGFRLYFEDDNSCHLDAPNNDESKVSGGSGNNVMPLSGSFAAPRAHHGVFNNNQPNDPDGGDFGPPQEGEAILVIKSNKNQKIKFTFSGLGERAHPTDSTDWSGTNPGIFEEMRLYAENVTSYANDVTNNPSLSAGDKDNPTNDETWIAWARAPGGSGDTGDPADCRAGMANIVTHQEQVGNGTYPNEYTLSAGDTYRFRVYCTTRDSWYHVGAHYQFNVSFEDI